MGYINEGLKTLLKINFLIEIDQLFREVSREFIKSQKSICVYLFLLLSNTMKPIKLFLNEECMNVSHVTINKSYY